MEEVSTIGLEVQSLPCRIRGKQNAQRVLRRIGIETALDFLSARAARETVDHLNSAVGAVTTLNHLLQDLLEISLRTLPVLGKDEYPAVKPLRSPTPRLLAKGGQLRA